MEENFGFQESGQQSRGLCTQFMGQAYSLSRKRRTADRQQQRRKRHQALRCRQKKLVIRRYRRTVQ